MARRTPETLADYLVVAICPALIMMLVGSLLFFLVEVFYQGQFELRTLWVLAMFVMGVVCLARLSMEEGYAYASMYAAPLGILVGIALSRFVQFGGPLAPISLLVNWALMGWVWWCAHQLTWDCTLIDDSQDASGEGLLQQMGLDQEAGPAGPEATTAAPSANVVAADPAPAQDASSTDWWQRDWWQRIVEPDRRPHPPGVWVVYFSLGALPMFGIGGRFISLENLDSRRWCFWMLVLYVASAMALLLATSFLGLRKYLRQRRLEMPLDMTATWVAAGTVLIVATIVVASLIPRPSPEYSLAQLIKVDSPELWASRWGFGPEGAKSKSDQSSAGGAEQQEGQQADQHGGGKSDPNNKSGSPQSGKQGSGDAGNKNGGSQHDQSKQEGQSQSQQNQSQTNQSQESQSQTNQSQQGDSKSDPGQSQAGSDQKQGGENQQNQDSQKQNQQDQNQQEQNQKTADQSDQNKNDSSSNSGNASNQDNQKSQDEQNKKEQPSRSESSESGSGSGSNRSPTQLIEHVQTAISGLGGILRAILYLTIAIVAVFLAWRYRAQLWAAWKKLLEELAALWPGLFPKRRTDEATDIAPPAPPRPFSQFADPFASGAAAQMSPAEVVRYTFAALEAWGRENGCPRDTGQTPHEFAAAIGDLDSTLSREAAQLADLYARMAYAPPAAIRTSFEPLRSLWQKMAAPAVQVVGA